MSLRNALLVIGSLLIISINFLDTVSSSDFENLSYSRDVMYGGSALPDTTTKKSGIFSSLKKVFSRGESSTVPNIEVSSNSPIIPSKPTSSIIVPPPLSHKIPVNPNTQGISSHSRDYVNPNIKPGFNQEFSFNPTNEQITGRRDIINPNIRPGTLPAPVRPDGQMYQPINPNGSNRRDYVNPNIRPNILPIRSDGQINSNSVSTPINPWNNNQPTPTTPKRDYVNPNTDSRGSRPSITHPIHLNPGSPTQPSLRPEYANPNAPNPRPPAIPHSSGPTSFNANDFPTLSPPRGASKGSNIGDLTTPKKPLPSGNNVLPQPNSTPPQSRPNSGQHNNLDSRRQPTTNNNQNGLATDSEIISLSESLYNKDVNNQNRFITLNLQGKTKSSDITDEAPNKLMEVNEQALVTPTIAKMRLLFDNYELDTMTNEYVAPIERREESDFLDVVMATTVMKQAMIFLQQKGLITPDPEKHRDLIRTIWFTLYSRGRGKIGSSAFEHVFLSELKNGSVIGLHNWVYYYDQEKAGNIDYKGYIKKVDLGNKGSIVKFRFDHKGIGKPVNALFVGTSPELEMALYTVCFQVRADKDCPVSMAGTRFNIVTHSWRYRGKNLIGSAYPEI